ncbi:unnamed protein product, partial [Ilex paraguariensis]
MAQVLGAELVVVTGTSQALGKEFLAANKMQLMMGTFRGDGFGTVTGDLPPSSRTPLIKISGNSDSFSCPCNKKHKSKMAPTDDGSK